MRRIRFTGFPTGSSVSLEASQGVETVAANAATWGALAGLATFTAGQWSLNDEPSVTGDVAVIDFFAVPEQVGHTAECFEILKDDGVTQTVEMVLMGPLLNSRRRIRVAAGTTTSVQARVVWREDATGFEIAGQWSPVRTVVPTVGAPVLTLAAGRTAGVAPLGIQFEAELAGTGGLRPFHDVRYKWTFPETGDWTGIASDFEWARQKQTDFGPVCAFTFVQPNTAATVTCEATFYNPVTGQNETITEAIVIEVEDPDVVFAGSNTITVGDRGQGDDYDAADIGAAASAISGVGAGRVRRLSLRRGLTYSGAISISTNQNLVRLSITAHGTGNDPVIEGIDLRELQPGGEATVSGLDAVGPYDPRNPETTSVGPDHFFFNFSGVPVTLHGCRSRGGKIAVFCSQSGTIISDCDIGHWFDYGVLGNIGFVSLVGTSIKQDPSVLRLGDGKLGANVSPYFADHGPFRFGGDIQGATSFSKCDIFSNSNWADNAIPQNPIRWNSGGELGKTFYLNMCQIEGGGFGFGVNPGLGRGLTPQYLLCERFRHVATGSGNQALTVTLGGTTFRNAIVVQPDVPGEGPDTLRQLVRLGIGTAPHKNGNEFNPVEVHNCALIDLRSDANALAPFDPNRARESQDFYTDILGFAFDPSAVTTTNNIFHAPNRSVGSGWQQNGQAPLDTAQGRAPNYPGAKVSGLVDITYSGLTGGSFVISNKTQVTLTGATSGATANPYGLDLGGQVPALMTSAADFQPGETVNITGEMTGSFVLDTVTARDLLMTRYANTADVTASFAPLDTSPAIGAASSGKVAPDDWNGVLRATTLASLTRSTPSAGPYEPELEGDGSGGGQGEQGSGQGSGSGVTGSADFSDDFNRADAPDLGPNWAVLEPGWTIVGNAAQTTENARSQALTPASSADMEVAFSYTGLTGDIAVFVRDDTGPSFVRFRVRTNRFDVIQRNAGVWGSEYRSTGIVPPSSGTLRCRLIGQSFEILLDDVTVHSGTIAEPAIDNQTGNVTLFAITGQTIDDFAIGSLA